MGREFQKLQGKYPGDVRKGRVVTGTTGGRACVGGGAGATLSLAKATQCSASGCTARRCILPSTEECCKCPLATPGTTHAAVPLSLAAGDTAAPRGFATLTEPVPAPTVPRSAMVRGALSTGLSGSPSQPTLLLKPTVPGRCRCSAGQAVMAQGLPPPVPHLDPLLGVSPAPGEAGQLVVSGTSATASERRDTGREAMSPVTRLMAAVRDVIWASSLAAWECSAPSFRTDSRFTSWMRRPNASALVEGMGGKGNVLQSDGQRGPDVGWTSRGVKRSGCGC